MLGDDLVGRRLLVGLEAAETGDLERVLRRVGEPARRRMIRSLIIDIVPRFPPDRGPEEATLPSGRMQPISQYRRRPAPYDHGVLRRAALFAALAAVLVPAAAEAGTYPPHGKDPDAGVSDCGSKQDYFDFADAVGRHVPVMQAFETWNAWNQEAIKRWKRTETRGTSEHLDDRLLRVRGRSARGDPQGKGGRYPLTVNRKLAQWGRPIYIRLLPEMNGHWNPYSAFDADGSRRGRSHKTAQFRKAWKRTAIVVRGGPRREINHKLKANKMPALTTPERRPAAEEHPATEGRVHLGAADLGIARRQGQRPPRRPAGGEYVDWIGADIYGKFPNFGGLDHFTGTTSGCRSCSASGGRGTSTTRRSPDCSAGSASTTARGWRSTTRGRPRQPVRAPPLSPQPPGAP